MAEIKIVRSKSTQCNLDKLDWKVRAAGSGGGIGDFAG